MIDEGEKKYIQLKFKNQKVKNSGVDSFSQGVSGRFCLLDIVCNYNFFSFSTPRRFHHTGRKFCGQEFFVYLQ